MEELFRPSEVKKILKVSYPTVLDYIHKGKLKAVRIGHQWRIKNSDLEAFMEERGFKVPNEVEDSP